jgi:hypothetical protein
MPNIRAHKANSTFPGEMTIGNIQSRTALRLIGEWAVSHEAELQANLGADEGRSAAQQHCTA